MERQTGPPSGGRLIRGRGAVPGDVFIGQGEAAPPRSGDKRDVVLCGDPSALHPRMDGAEVNTAVRCQIGPARPEGNDVEGCHTARLWA